MPEDVETIPRVDPADVALKTYRPLRQRKLNMLDSASLERAEGTATVQIAPSARVDRRVLVTIDVDPRLSRPAMELTQRSAATEAFESPPLLCSRIEGGSVATSAAIALTAAGEWVIESVEPAPVGDVVPLRPFRRIRIGTRRRYVAEPVGIVYSVLSPKKHSNYYHWALEGLTRAVMLAEARVPQTVNVLVPAPVTELHLQSLTAVGIAEPRILEWSGTPTDFPVVFLPTGPQHRGFSPPASAVKLLREAVFRGETPPPTSRLWVSRRLARRRRVPGEEGLFAVARKLGFVEVVAEELSVSEQIALFAGAEAVAGIHGAGLANALFMSPNGALVEAAPSSLKPRQKPFFWNLAAACGHRYACCVGSGDGFDVTRFERVLVEALASRRS